jgi:anti-anti-sigma factor
MLRIDVTRRDGIVCVNLKGEFTPEQISDFTAHVEQALSDGWTKILVDASEAPFINSTAFGALIKARGILRAEGGELALAALAGMPKETFEILQLGNMIPSFATVEEGIDSLKWIDASAAVPEDEDLRVEFRFKGHDETILAGSDWHAAGLQAVSERELQFLWNAPEGLDLFRLFTPKTRLDVRASLRHGAAPEDLEAPAVVLNMVPAPEGAALVQVELVDPDDAGRAAVRECVRRHHS